MITLEQLAQAAQALVPWQQVFGSVFAAAVYWLLPERWRWNALLPISVITLILAFERWPALLLGAMAIGIATHVACKWRWNAGQSTTPVIVMLTVVYCLLHALLGILTHGDQLAWTEITAATAISQAGTAVMFGYLRLWQYARDGNKTNWTLRDMLTWLMFFPTFTRLPLVRSHELLPMRSEVLRSTHVRRAFKHAAIWQAKSFLAAAIFSLVPQLAAIQSPALFSAAETWLGLTASVVLFYLAFSGNVDFAIASCALLGIDVPDNFSRIDKLLTNTRARDFWRNWNFTVTRWLQDYVYQPLGGIRQHPLRNTLLTMVFCGLWHSISPLGLLWGLGFGGLMLLEHHWTRLRLRRFKTLPTLPGALRAVAWLTAFSVLQIAQVPFSYQADGGAALGRLYARLLGIG